MNFIMALLISISIVTPGHIVITKIRESRVRACVLGGQIAQIQVGNKDNIKETMEKLCKESM